MRKWQPGCIEAVVMTCGIRIGVRGAFLAFLGVTLTSALAFAASGGEATCRSDADCGADFRCEKSCSTPGCSTPPNCPAQVSTCDEVGTCAPKLRACAAASDCPAGLSCAEGPDGVCSQSPGGQATCTAGKPVCTFVQKTCTTAAECGAEEECIRVDQGGCGGLALENGGVPACDPKEVRTCFPKRVDCQPNGGCAAGRVCVAFGTSEAPPHWGATGPVQACLPADLAFTLQGHAYLKGPGFSPAGRPESVSAGGTGAAAAPTAATKNPGSGKGGDGAGGGCSLGGGGAGTWTILGAALLALGQARGRRRR